MQIPRQGKGTPCLPYSSSTDSKSLAARDDPFFSAVQLQLAGLRGRGGLLELGQPRRSPAARRTPLRQGPAAPQQDVHQRLHAAAAKVREQF